MNNNEVLTSVKSIFGFDNLKMTEIYNILNDQVTQEQLDSWLSQPSEDNFLHLNDVELSTFLNAFICAKRGKKEGPQPEPEIEITNNIILKKLKIALELKNEDIVDLLKSVDMSINNYELTSFFRKPTHKNYRPIRDRLLRSFLMALASLKSE